MWRLSEQAFVGRRSYESPKNDCVGGYLYSKCSKCDIAAED